MSRRVLIVDDSPTVLAMLKIYLGGMDLSFVEASNGNAALLQVRHERFDLLISDVEMPGITGIELTEAIRAGAHQPTLPIVLMTASVVSFEDRARRAGATAIISKPVFGSPLKRLVDTLFGNVPGKIPGETRAPLG